MRDHDNLTAADWARIDADRDASMRRQLCGESANTDFGMKMRQEIANAVLADLLTFLKYPIFNSAHQAEALFVGRVWSRTEAYLWMLERAVRRDGLSPEGYRVSKEFILPVARGEFCRAEGEMGQAWNWTRKAVRNFLEALQEIGALTKITPVGFSQQRLAALRVPSAYQVALIVRWYDETMAAVDGALLEASEAARGSNSVPTASPEQPIGSEGPSTATLERGFGSKQGATATDLAGNDVSWRGLGSKGSVTATSALRRGDRPHPRGHAWGHARHEERPINSTKKAIGKRAEGPREGPTKDIPPPRVPRVPMIENIATPSGIVRRAYKRDKSFVVPVMQRRGG